MIDKLVDLDALDAALDRVVAAARGHLAAVKAADGEPDDDGVWQAYVALNNASYEYDELLNDVFGEVTPWDLEEITAEDAPDRLHTVTSGEHDGIDPLDDPYPHVVSVRQRRDYRIPSVTALLHVAQAARGPVDADEGVEEVTTVAEAMLELMQVGDGSLGMLDMPELEALDGIAVVAEVAEPLDTGALPESEGEVPFQLGAADRLLGRIDERALLDIDR